MALSKPVTKATIDEEETPKPKKVAKAKGPTKLVANKLVPAGSNSGLVPGMVEIVEEILSIDDKIKELGKAKRDLRNKAKDEYSVLAFNLNEELRMRKLADDTRKQYEAGRMDLQTMLGYQASLDLRAGTTPRTEEEYVNPSIKLREGDPLVTRG